MIDLLNGLGISVPPHNHLVEVESHTECPEEVCKEEEVQQHGAGDTEDAVVEVEGEVEEELCEEDAHTEVDNELDGVCSHLIEYHKGEYCGGASKERQCQHHIHNVVQRIGERGFCSLQPHGFRMRVEREVQVGEGCRWLEWYR